MGITTDRDDPALQQIRPDGQQAAYLVLSEEERAKGYVLPVRRKYIHVACGTETIMPVACAETAARSPTFYSGTYCCACGKHFPLLFHNPKTGQDERAFTWLPEGDPMGASAEEAQTYLKAQARRDATARFRALQARRDRLAADLKTAEEELEQARFQTGHSDES